MQSTRVDWTTGSNVLSGEKKKRGREISTNKKFTLEVDGGHNDDSDSVRESFKVRQVKKRRPTLDRRRHPPLQGRPGVHSDA